MGIDRTPSGKYRIRKTINGQTISVVVDHKPTEKEVVKLIAEKLASSKVYTPSSPFKKACEAYLEAKTNIISPSTIRGYKSVIRQLSEKFGNTPINSLTTQMVQAEINRYAAEHSPKSTANYYGFIVSVLKFYDHAPGHVTLPQREKKPIYIPTYEEVKKIFENVKGSKYEVPILLAGMGLRRSEICALHEGDLVGNVLTINKAVVQDENLQWVEKSTKTTDSTRQIVLPPYLVDLINKNGFYDGHPELIYRKLTQVQDQLGIPHFSLHKMRHFYASYMHDLGFSDKQLQEAGGWKSDRILKTVYQHAMEMDQVHAAMADEMGKLM